MKYWVILAFIAIFVSLGTALLFMLKSKDGNPSRSRKMAHALGLRVGISILLFLSILLAWQLGYIHPTGIAAGQ